MSESFSTGSMPLYPNPADIPDTITVSDLVDAQLLTGLKPGVQAEIASILVPQLERNPNLNDTSQSLSSEIRTIMVDPTRFVMNTMNAANEYRRRESESTGENKRISSSLFFSTRTIDGNEQLTRVDWTNARWRKDQYTKLPRFRDFFDAHFRRNFIVNTPIVRIMSVDADVLNESTISQTPFQVSGYSIGDTVHKVKKDSNYRKIFKVGGMAVSQDSDLITSYPPYFRVDEPSVTASLNNPSIFSSNRLTQNGDLRANDDANPDVRDFKALLCQLIPANVAVLAPNFTRSDLIDVATSGTAKDIEALRLAVDISELLFKY